MGEGATCPLKKYLTAKLSSGNKIPIAALKMPCRGIINSIPRQELKKVFYFVIIFDRICTRFSSNKKMTELSYKKQADL